MWAQLSVTLVVRGRYRTRPAADHRRYVDVALARAKAASGFLLGWLAQIIIAIVLFTTACCRCGTSRTLPADCQPPA
jgi:hypothetical protein